MNKQDYIRQLDGITVPDELKMKLGEIPNASTENKRPGWKKITAIAACFALICVVIGQSADLFNGGSKLASNGVHSESYSITEDSADEVKTESTAGSANGSTVQSNRKIIKNVQLHLKTENLNELMSALNESTGMYDGFTENYSENNYSYDRSVQMTVRIPSDKLDAFITNVKKLATVTSMQMSKSDITDSYIDTESSIEALKTEEKALLKLLEKAENLSDIISLQDRLTQVKGELESQKRILESYDSQIDYSQVSFDISESERVNKSDGSYGSELKEKFRDSLYSLGTFFRDLSLDVLGNAPYILLIAIVVVAVILIIKKRKR